MGDQLQTTATVTFPKITTTKKRTANEIDVEEGSSKQPSAKRIHPFFAKPSEKVASDASDSKAFCWKKLPFLSSTCLYGENLTPEIRPKIAAFDLDGTIIKWSPPKKEISWEYWHKDIPQFMKSAHDSGSTVVIFSNQNYKEKQLVLWKQKIQLFAKSLHNVPFILLAATEKDGYRKPMPGMWLALETCAQNAGVTIDKESSFFVGDAAGRKGDFSGTDRKFANNLGLRFFTPEEHFLKRPAQEYELKGVHASKEYIVDGPRIIPTSSPILPLNLKQPELLIFVGSPASGKSSFFRDVFLPAGYTHINQDTLGSRPKCLKMAEESLQEGKSCVIDNTNRNKQTRKLYVDLAKKHNVPVRCFVFKISPELAWHNNLYRQFIIPLITNVPVPGGQKLIPLGVIASFAKEFEEPTIEEGFNEVKTVNWQFEGDSEKERYWRMWLQIAGK